MSIEKYDGVLTTKENTINLDFTKKMWENYLKNKSDSEHLSLFVKIPYCINKCKYCFYYVDEYKDSEQIDYYLDFLEKQALLYSDTFKEYNFKTIYIGGGTPSLLENHQIKRLFSIIKNNFSIDVKENQVSFECHPATLDKSKIDFIYNETPVNRLSIGIQTLDPLVLQEEMRISRQKEHVLDLVQYAKSVFSRKEKSIINTDIIAGLANQSVDSLIESFKELSDIESQKITVYSKITKVTHDPDVDDRLSELRNIYIEPLLEYVEKSGLYDYERDITNENFYNFVRSDYDPGYNLIYLERPSNIDGSLNSVLGLGHESSSWMGLENAYYISRNAIYYNNQFYWLLHSLKENYKSYHFSGMRKKLYS